jgi:hypothetical protein
MVRTLLNIQLLFYGMTYLMILETLPILTKLKTFYIHEMAINVNAMLVKKYFSFGNFVVCSSIYGF